jgi:hypothetical protein
MEMTDIPQVLNQDCLVSGSVYARVNNIIPDEDGYYSYIECILVDIRHERGGRGNMVSLIPKGLFAKCESITQALAKSFTSQMFVGDTFEIDISYSNEENTYDNDAITHILVQDKEQGRGGYGSRADLDAKIEAYCDPRVAEISELSKTGLKTRSSFYKRS